MYNWTNIALETARLRGASYADVRVMHQRQRDLTTKNGKVGTLAQSESIGLGIRVLANGAWGFASTDRLTREGVASCAAQAVAIAKASATAKRHDVVMVEEQAHIDSWQSPFRKDPFEIPLETQLSLLVGRRCGNAPGEGCDADGNRYAIPQNGFAGLRRALDRAFISGK